MKFLLAAVHWFLYCATFALAVHHYHPLNVTVYPWLYYVLGLAVVGISLMIMVFHIVGGGLMGLSAGGVLSGMKYGFMVGMTMAVGRLWPYLFAIALASGLFNIPWYHWHTWGFLILAILAGGLDVLGRFFRHGHNPASGTSS
ncbi:MAG: hypothetical protein GC134_04325 [Proteobacteria bacterium]|nr:hypothetical protein [Pseudomonadota bacterium]